MGKIIKHPAIRKRSGGARRLTADEKEVGQYKCGYTNCKDDADRAIGHYKTLLCESHYQQLRK